MAESNQKHMKPSWATGQTVSIREESIIDNGSFLGGQFSSALTSSSSVTFTQVLAAGGSDATRHYNNDYGYIARRLTPANERKHGNGTKFPSKSSGGEGDKDIHSGSCKSPVKLSGRLPVAANGVGEKGYYV